MLFNLKVITRIAVTLAFFVLAAQTSDLGGANDGIAIPLTKHSATSHDAKIIRGPSGMDGSEKNTGTPHPSAVQRDWWAILDLTKFANGVWCATIFIGTPPMPFFVQLNTGTSDLFVAASTGDQNCRSHSAVWDPASSHITNFDLDIDFVERFADGRMAAGKQYLDNVTIAGLTADVQTIGAATTYSPTMAEARFAPDGVLGLAFPAYSGFRDQSPLFHTLFNEGKLSQPMFSLKLTDSGGELYIGGMDRRLYIQDTLAYAPVTNPVLWELMIDDIRIDGRIILTNILAVVDTGANFIYGDAERVLTLHRWAGGRQYMAGRGLFIFPCRRIPTMTFTIGGMPFTLLPDHLSKGRVEPWARDCFSGIATVVNQHHDFWSIGSVFLQQYYTVFDFNTQSPRVGFAYLA